MTKITASLATEHFTEMFSKLYGEAPRCRWSTIPEHADTCGALLLFDCGGDIETGDMILSDLRTVSNLSISAHGAMAATPERPFFSYQERIEEPVQTFFIHLDRQAI